MPEESQNTPIPQASNPSVLDKPVPNPLAKNPNFFTHKVFAAIGIILAGTVLVLFGLTLIYHVNLADLFKTAPVAENNSVSTSSAVPAGNNDWITYTNTTVGYTVKYPKNWVSSNSSEEKDCGVRFGVNKDQLGYCAAGNGGLLQLGLVTINASQGSVTTQVNNLSKVVSGFKQTNTTVGGKTAVKITGTQNDNKEIDYLVDLSGSVLIIGYYQGAQITTDYSADFEKIVLTFKFDETAGWKVYSNSKYSYQFKYPTNYIFSENNSATGWHNAGETMTNNILQSSGLYLKGMDIGGGLPFSISVLNEVLDTSLARYRHGLTSSDKEETITLVGATKAVKFTVNIDRSVNIFAQKGSYVYWIHASSAYGGENNSFDQEMTKSFPSIISTFKFL